MNNWLTSEEAVKVLSGEFDGSNEELLEVDIIDTDGDKTTLAVEEREWLSVFVTYKGGKFERIGKAKNIGVNVDTHSIKVTLDDPSLSNLDRGWSFTLPLDLADQDAVEVAKQLYRIGRPFVTFKVLTEHGIKTGPAAEKAVYQEYASILGSSTIPLEVTEEIMSRSDNLLLELAAIDNNMKEVRKAWAQINEDVMPTLSCSAQQLRVIFASIDIIEKWVSELSTHTASLEKTVNTFAAPSSLMSKAKRLFSISKAPQPEVPTTLQIGGLTPAAYLEQLQGCLGSFQNMNDPAPQTADPKAVHITEGEEDEGSEG
eukprot:TRINITY_DN37900_c0_g1_i1.p1 TRINITY_DN37900_c0_g1~~TRINITY_DN37900_c0_g1_i1.p1  ORF type:complete len:333 (+),score=65.18 TRINITY_DN37900_c0_g1_i1:55-999(+)